MLISHAILMRRKSLGKTFNGTEIITMNSKYIIGYVSISEDSVLEVFNIIIGALGIMFYLSYVQMLL